MSILENAINSIQMGIEDYKIKNNGRDKSAVRNIYSGLLLLYKEKLRRLSPNYDKDLLIKNEILPYLNSTDGTIYFKSSGDNTLNFGAIKKRFRTLGVYVDWEKFYTINKLRNNIEHYYTKESTENIREILSKSFILIRNFIVNELEEDPLDLIDNSLWKELLTISEVYEAEEKTCRDSFQEVDWKFKIIADLISDFRCNECQSSLIKMCGERCYPDIELQCNSCGHKFNFNDVVEDLIKENFKVETFIALKDGGELPNDTCPECNLDTFVFSENCCVFCEYEMEYSNCNRCDQALSLGEQYLDGLCDYCANMMGKD